LSDGISISFLGSSLLEDAVFVSSTGLLCSFGTSNIEVFDGSDDD
jgi:hypothetical protein